jgi:hypothetical protein
VTIPANYNLPDHLGRIFESPEFEQAAKDVGKSAAEFRHDVANELKTLNEDQKRVELRTYEQQLGAEALHAALVKFKKDVEAELKALHSRNRANELAAHEARTGQLVVASAVARGTGRL